MAERFNTVGSIITEDRAASVARTHLGHGRGVVDPAEGGEPYLILQASNLLNHTANVHLATTSLSNKFKFWGITFWRCSNNGKNI